MVVFAITTYNFLSIPFLVLFVFGYYWAGFATLYQEHQSRLRWLKSAQPGTGAAGVARQRRSWPVHSRSYMEGREPVLRSLRDPAVAHVHGGMSVRGGFRIVRDHQDGLPEALVQIAQNLQHGGWNSPCPDCPVGSSASRIAG